MTQELNHVSSNTEPNSQTPVVDHQSTLTEDQKRVIDDNPIAHDWLIDREMNAYYFCLAGVEFTGLYEVNAACDYVEYLRKRGLA